jgi:hypothetical protein
MKFLSRSLYAFFFALLILSSGLLLKSTTADTTASVSPQVAIHVSEYTQAHWEQTGWTYPAIYRMLEEALKSDGTPFVEITDSQIESGALLTSGTPKYPILFSLTSDCISDTEALQISNYVASGGFVYLSASSWTRYQDGTARDDIALSTQMGLTCETPTPNNWATVTTVKRIADNQLVNDIPKNIDINWRLPLTNHTVCTLATTDTEPHLAWATKTTTTNPANVLMTTDGKVMLAEKQYLNGMFIYNSELTPLASYSLYSPVAYEYKIIKQTIELAFKTQNIPLAKLSAWPYQYDSAFIIRHDMDWSQNSVPWIVTSATAEKNLGVTGQYYIVTGDVRDNPDSAQLISLLQQAQSLGAQIGSHNGGLNCTPWDPTLIYGDYLYYHWGPDIAMSEMGMTNGTDYAINSIKASFDDLQTWLGQRPTIWVAPAGQGVWPESYQILDNLGITTSGEFTTSPYPNFALNINNPAVSYSNFAVPFSRWITDTGTVCQSIEGMEQEGVNMQELVDFYYNMGALISPYGHSSSESGLTHEFIVDALAKPNMWSTTPTELRQWALQRNQITSTEQLQTDNGISTITINLAGSNSADTAIEVTLPTEISKINSLQVLINDSPSSNYRLTDNGLKVQAGYASKVTVRYSTNIISAAWTQTTQADFKTGTLIGLDSDSAPGELTIAPTVTTRFTDDFSSSSLTNSTWTIRSGNWTVNDGYYTIVGTPGQLSSAFTYTGDNWNNVNVETRAQYISGDFSGELSARLDPNIGSRYSFILYPSNISGPNHAAIVKFSSWTDLTGTILDQGTVSTDTNWHTLRMELDGSNIRCYYDGALLFDVIDSSYAYGRIALESFGESTAQYDWVQVTSITRSSGMFVSSAFDSESTHTNWQTISWTADMPSGTNIRFMTRTASTQAGLASAPWSNYYAVSGITVTSYQNRWIQYGAIFSSSDGQSTPTLYSVTISYVDATPPGIVHYQLNMGMTASVG